MYSCALKYYKSYRNWFHAENFDCDEDEPLIREIEDDRSLSDTEKESLVTSRIGQGKYREGLLKSITVLVL